MQVTADPETELPLQERGWAGMQAGRQAVAASKQERPKGKRESKFQSEIKDPLKIDKCVTKWQ